MFMMKKMLKIYKQVIKVNKYLDILKKQNFIMFLIQNRILIINAEDYNYRF